MCLCTEMCCAQYNGLERHGRRGLEDGHQKVPPSIRILVTKCFHRFRWLYLASHFVSLSMFYTDGIVNSCSHCDPPHLCLVYIRGRDKLLIFSQLYLSRWTYRTFVPNMQLVELVDELKYSYCIL